jgi:GNAT superfamily N-acetyltransferase
MTAVESWRAGSLLEGPFPMTSTDVVDVNRVFSDAFTDRYHRDGLVGVRVPQLSNLVWRYAIADAAGGAMLWRTPLGEVVAFNLAHCSGIEGWMGPLAVASTHQGVGLGKTIVRTALAWLRSRGARVIGLETMPRTMDNIGFYGSLGFLPAHLTITVTLDAVSAEPRPELLGHAGSGERAALVAECAALSADVRPGVDHTREITTTLRHGIGDVVLLRDGAEEIVGYALYHDVPLVEGRSREELRALKVVARDVAALGSLWTMLRVQARRSGALRAAIRVQGAYQAVFRSLVAHGARVRWTDLRMTLSGYEESPSDNGVALSNWEI